MVLNMDEEILEEETPENETVQETSVQYEEDLSDIQMVLVQVRDEAHLARVGIQEIGGMLSLSLGLLIGVLIIRMVLYR